MGKDGTLQKLLHELMMMNNLSSESPGSKVGRKELALGRIRASKETSELQAMRFRLIDTIFKHEKGRIEHMNSLEMKNMITCALSMKIIEGKFIGGLSNLIENKYKILPSRLLAKVLVLYSIQSVSTQETIKKQVINILRYFVSQGKIKKLSTIELKMMAIAVQGLDKGGFFKTGSSVSLNLMEELVDAADSKMKEVLQTGGSRDGGYLKSMGDLSVLLSTLMSGGIKSESLVRLLISFPEECCNPQMTVMRTESILQVEEELTKEYELAKGESSPNPSFPSLKVVELEYKLNQIKKKLINLHNRLSASCGKLDTQSLVRALPLMIKLEERYGLPMSNMYKKVLCNSFIRNSEKFSLPAIVDITENVMKCIKGGDEMVMRILDRFAFSQYSDLTQMEYRYRINLQEQLNNMRKGVISSMQANRLKATKTRYIDLDDVESNQDPDKFLFRINTLMVNSIFIMNVMISKNKRIKDSLVFQNISIDESSYRHMTLYGLYMIHRYGYIGEEKVSDYVKDDEWSLLDHKLKSLIDRFVIRD